MRNLASKIKNIIEYALVSVVSGDSDDNQVSQVDTAGKPLECNMVSPYGLSSNAPSGSSVLRFLIGGSSQDSCGIAFNSANRFKGLKPWEVAVGNFLKKNRILFDEDGGIIIDVIESGQEITIKTESGQVKIESNGTVNVNNGNLEVLV